MMIGPDPITRMRFRSFRRGIDYVVDDLKMSEPRRPSRGRLELRRISHEFSHIAGPSERRVRRNVGRHAHTLQDSSGQLARAQADAAAHIVDLSRYASTNDGQIGLG